MSSRVPFEGRGFFVRVAAPVVLAMCVSLTAGAASVADSDLAARCRALPPLVHFEVVATGARGSDGCSFTHPRITVSSRVGWTAERLDLEAVDFATIEAGHPPRRLRAVAHGVYNLLATSDPVGSYTIGLALARHAMDVTLDYALLSDDGDFRLNEFSMSGPDVGSLRLAATLDKIDVPASLAPSDLGFRDAGLKTLDLHFVNDGFVETKIAPILGPMLLAGATDPEAKVVSLKADAIRSLRATLVASSVDPATIDALAAFVADLPHPGKALDIHLVLAKPVSIKDGIAQYASERSLASILAGGSLRATYGP